MHPYHQTFPTISEVEGTAIGKIPFKNIKSQSVAKILHLTSFITFLYRVVLIYCFCFILLFPFIFLHLTFTFHMFCGIFYVLPV